MKLPLDDLTALVQRSWGSFLGRCVHRFIQMGGIDRSLVLSSQAFTALIPLLILVSTFAPPGGPAAIANTIITKFGLTGPSADSVEQLFEVQGEAASSMSVASAILLIYSGVSFTRRLQKMYRASWSQEKTGLRGNLFAALGLFVMMALVFLSYGIISLVRRLPGDWLLVLPLSALLGLAPWTLVPYLLLNRQVHWRRLLAAGALTAVTMACYGAATTIYMPDLIEQYTNEFGLFGVTVAIIGWLLVAAGIVVASTAVGSEFDHSVAGWALRAKARFGLSDPTLPPPEPSGDQPEGLTIADLVVMARVALTFLVMATAVWVATVVVPGIDVDGGALTYLWVSIVLGLVNALMGPVLRLFVPDVHWPGLGLVALFVNGVLLALTALLSPNLSVEGLADAIVGALVISLAIAACEFTAHRVTRVVSPARDEPRRL